MSFAVRGATPEDFPAIGELTVAAYRGDGQTWSGHPYEGTLLDAATRAGAGTLLVAASDEGVLGAVLFAEAGSEYAELAREGEAEFRMLAVAPWAQRRGVGEALASACLGRARELGCHSVVISVRDFATDAQRLWLLNSSAMQRKLEGSPRIRRILRESRDDPGRTVNSLYLLILARPPDAGELEVATAYYKTPGINPKQATDDVAWALINSKEFLFRH